MHAPASLHRFSVRHPFYVLIFALLMIGAALPGLFRLKLRTDGHALVPIDDPIVRHDEEVRQRFGVRDLMIALIRTRDARGVFNAQTLQSVERLTKSVQSLPGIAPKDVFSFATELGDQVYPGTLDFRPMLDPFPATERELQALREMVVSFRIYRGTLLSQDEHATSVMVGVPPDADRTRLYQSFRELAENEVRGDEVHVIGAPVAEALLGTHILEDLGVPRALLGEHVAGAAESGGPALPRLAAVRRFIAQHVGLVPIVILIMGAIFFITFRNVAAAALPLLEVLATLVIVFGLMGWCGSPIYLTLAIMPVILCAMGVTDEIHVFAHYVERRREHPEEEVATSVRVSFDDMLPPVVKTSLTTAAGFISFAFSSLPSVQAFGIWTAVGMIVCMGLSFTVIPALVVLLKPMKSNRSSPHRLHEGSGSPALARLTQGVLKHRRPILVVFVIVVAAAPFGVTKIVVQDSWISGFSPHSEYYRATQDFNEQFFGSHLLMLEADIGHSDLRGTIPEKDVRDFELRIPIEPGLDPRLLVGATLSVRRPGATERQTTRPSGQLVWNDWASIVVAAERDGSRAVLHTLQQNGSPRFVMGFAPSEAVAYEVRTQRHSVPDVLRRLAELESFIRAQGLTVGGVLGPPDYLETTNFIVTARKESFRTIPDDIEKCAWLWKEYRRVRHPERFAQLVDADSGKCLVTVFMKHANYRDTAELMRRIDAYEAEHLRPFGISLAKAGDVAVSQAMIGAIVRTEVLSLVVSLVGVLAVVVILSRSIGWGLLCIMPCLLAVLGNFAVMGWLHMPLGIATSMFAGMSMGIGVDFAIHLAERHRQLLATGLSPVQAVTRAASTCGLPILVDGLAVSLGFGVLTLSQVPANSHLGTLTVATILVALVATMGVLPILFTLGSSRSATGGEKPAALTL